MSHPFHDQNNRLREQIRKIREHFAVAVGPPGAEEPHGTPRYLAEQGYLLVRESTANPDDTVNQDLVAQHIRVRPGAPRVRRHRVTRLPIEEDVAEAMVRLDAVPELRHPRPRMVAPNHLITITPVNGCPADEPVLPVRPGAMTVARPQEETLLVPPLTPFPVGVTTGIGAGAGVGAGVGTGVDVLVVDTGLLDDALTHSWLAGHGEVPEVDGLERKPHPPGEVTLYLGHGTFIAGVLRCVAPATRVRVHNALRNAGTIDEVKLGDILLKVLNGWTRSDGRRGWPDIISLSAGAPTHGTFEPLAGLDEFLRQLDEHPETVLVCAAGNDGERCQPFWPAAYAPQYERSRAIIAVGALRQDGLGRACFTNYGDWVTVYAPGERLVNAFTTGTYTNAHGGTADCRYYPGAKYGDALYEDCTCVTGGGQYDRVEFGGLACWSGTSFATPIVAGHIARRMTEGPGRSSRQAAQYLMDERVELMRDKADNKVLLPVLLDALPSPDIAWQRQSVRQTHA